VRAGGNRLSASPLALPLPPSRSRALTHAHSLSLSLSHSVSLALPLFVSFTARAAGPPGGVASLCCLMCSRTGVPWPGAKCARDLHIADASRRTAPMFMLVCLLASVLQRIIQHMRGTPLRLRAPSSCALSLPAVLLFGLLL